MKHSRRGFTIVELIVVIVLIGLLAGISVLVIGNWRNKNARDTVKSDLKHFSAAMETYRSVNNGYATTTGQLVSLYNGDDSSEIVIMQSTATSYCVRGKSKTDPSVIMHISNGDSDAAPGDCT